MVDSSAFKFHSSVTVLQDAKVGNTALHVVGNTLVGLSKTVQMRLDSMTLGVRELWRFTPDTNTL